MTLRARLLLALAYVLLLAVVALEVPLGISVRDRIDGEVRLQARSQADLVAATAADALGRAQRPRLRRMVRAAAEQSRGRVIAVDARGRLLADSDGPAAGQRYASRPEIAAALRLDATQRTRRSDTLGADILVTAVPVLQAGRVAGAVRVSQSVAAVHRATRRAWVGLAVIGATVLALGLAAGAIIAAQVARPVHRLAAAARRVEAGDLTTRVRVEGSAEQRALAEAFNDMTGRVARQIDAQAEFVADASHQLRTPLTGLRLRLEGLREETTDPTRTAELDASLREVDRMAQMVAELLELSRAGERELPGDVLDLAGVARRAAGRWAGPAADAGTTVRDATTPGTSAPVWCAEADADRIVDVLVENAIRYAGPGGQITVVADWGRLAVEDDGPGLAEGEEELVFERFHRGSAGRRGAAPGTGLGLAIARAMAKRWRARVSLANRPEGGTRAELRFPVPAPPQA